MLHLPAAPPMSSRGFPRRSDSLLSTSKQVQQPTQPLTSIEDEIRDARRVQRQGQEDDLRYALERMINRVDELSTLLTQAYKSQSEMETSLKLARSNLQLALANNEMLEDALKRDGSSGGKDLGWRRWSEREGARRERIQEEEAAERERRASIDSPTTTPHANLYASPVLSDGASNPGSPATATVSPTPSQDGRFFRFKFGSGSAAPSRATSPPPLSKRVGSERDIARLASASSPSLVVAAPSKREEELAAQLESERVKRRTVCDEKTALEAEIESLSQALFEEANKMVAQERIKRAETAEELRQAKQEKEALKGALLVIEKENKSLKSGIDPTSRGRSSNVAYPDSPTSTPPVTERGRSSPKSTASTENRTVLVALGSSSQPNSSSPTSPSSNLNGQGRTFGTVSGTSAESPVQSESPTSGIAYPRPSSSLDFELEEPHWADTT